MTRRRVMATCTAALLRVCSAGAETRGVPAPPRSRALTLAVLPYQVPRHIHDLWTPVADWLAERLGTPARVWTWHDYEAYLGEVLRRQPELAYLGPLHYLRARGLGGYHALVGSSHRAIGCLVVRADSPLRAVEDLRGRVVAVLPPSAVMGRLQPQALLLDRGLVAGRDYRVYEVANNDLSIDAVISRRADAGAAALAVIEILPRGTRAQLRVLAETAPQPPVVIAASPHLPGALRERIAAALLAMADDAAGRAALARAGWERAVPVRDADYDATRELARRVGLAG